MVTNMALGSIRDIVERGSYNQFEKLQAEWATRVEG
jgi:hypothetical protein